MRVNRDYQKNVSKTTLFETTKANSSIPFKYDSLIDYIIPSEGLVEATLNDKSGFIDKTGKEVIPLKYDEVWCLAFRKEGFIGVKLHGKKGFVDLYGNEYFKF